MIDFKNAICDACNKKSVDVRTEVLMPTEADKQENRIRKRMVFRCEEHLNTPLEEIQRLAEFKANNSN